MNLIFTFLTRGFPLSYDIEVFIEVDINHSILTCFFWFTAQKFAWPEEEPG